MSGLALLLVAVGLSMDAFAVSICRGLGLRRMNWRNAAIVGAYYGAFQMLMPILGYLLAANFAQYIQALDHWIAFGLLALIGLNMIRESRKSAEEQCCGKTAEQPLGFRQMLPSALATSIDAMAVGVSFAFLGVRIFPAATSIGLVTFFLSMLGVYVGSIAGSRFQSKAELSGGIILIAIGSKILLEHTGILA